jgi:DNA primase
MPGIDFAAVRDRISILDVLRLLEVQPLHHCGDRSRGRCPWRCSDDPRAFVVNVATNKFYCHACRRSGNQLDLWSKTQALTIFDAAQDLCHRLNIPVPEIHHR